MEILIDFSKVILSAFTKQKESTAKSFSGEVVLFYVPIKTIFCHSIYFLAAKIYFASKIICRMLSYNSWYSIIHILFLYLTLIKWSDNDVLRFSRIFFEKSLQFKGAFNKRTFFFWNHFDLYIFKEYLNIITKNNI